jgi:prephenate dehydrogenase
MIINIAGGNGVMGRVHKPIFEKAGHQVMISGRNSTPSLEEAAKLSDLTIISVPLEYTEKIIRKVGSYCKAIMDFTSVKQLPIEWMLEYTRPDCEVAGLHPLYGNVDSVKDRTVVYCSTDRSEDKCESIADAFRLSGAKISYLEAEQHDRVVNGILQSNRVKLFETFIHSLEESGLCFRDIYRLAPPPTKILLDLIARQADVANDELYPAMRRLNLFEEELNNELKSHLVDAIEDYAPEKIRAFYGDELKAAQERAKKLIN